MMIIIMILPIVMIGFDAMDDLLDQWTPRAPTNIESFSLFNDFAIQLSIISFIKSWHAHRGKHTGIKVCMVWFHSHRGRSVDLENSHIHIRTCWVMPVPWVHQPPATRLLCSVRIGSPHRFGPLQTK